MRKKLFILLIGILFVSNCNYAVDVPRVKRNRIKHKIHFKIFNKKADSHNKWVAAGLDISLGLFGVHRLYLGTETHVPVMYTLTLGGGGVLILTDLGLLLFTKDVEKYADNSHIFMWSEKD